LPILDQSRPRPRPNYSVLCELNIHFKYALSAACKKRESAHRSPSAERNRSACFETASPAVRQAMAANTASFRRLPDLDIADADWEQPLPLFADHHGQLANGMRHVPCSMQPVEPRVPRQGPAGAAAAQVLCRKVPAAGGPRSAGACGALTRLARLPAVLECACWSTVGQHGVVTHSVTVQLARTAYDIAAPAHGPRYEPQSCTAARALRTHVT